MKLKELLNQIDQITTKNKLSRAWIVGGCPRDKYLGISDDISDIDVTTGDTSIEYLIKEFSIFLSKSYNFKLKTKPIDLAGTHAAYTSITLGNLNMDFSYHFVNPHIKQELHDIGIEKPSDMLEEMYSRDFFIDTLLMGMDLKEMHDLTHQAIPDLKKKIIRTCLAPEITFTANKNRVIRAIYLCSKLQFSLDHNIITWIQNNPDSILFSSEHTLREKLQKSFKLDADRTIYHLNLLRLWNKIPISKELYPFYLKRKK